LVYSGKNNRHSLGALTRLFSTPFASLACILLACLGRVLHLLMTFGFGPDKSFQLQAAKNFYLGHGISIYEAGKVDISQVLYQPLVKWPPAYSILAAPFNALGENNFLSGIIIIDVIACILFVVAARKLFLLLDAPLWQTNLYTLVNGFAFFHFAIGASTDLLCLAFFLAGIYYSLKLLKQPAIGKRSTVPAVLFLWLSGFTRFLAAPIALLIPVYLFLQAKRKDDQLLARRAARMCLAIVLLFILQFLLQKLLGGASIYLHPVEKGFFPSHLLEIAPFIYEAAGNLEPLAIWADRYSILPFATAQKIVVVLHLVLIVVIGVISLWWMIRRKFLASSFSDHFIFLAAILSVATLLILGYLSLTNGKIGGENGGWTYVSELRYYASPIFFIQLCIFSASLRKYKNRVLSILMKALLAFMLISALHAFLYRVKTVIKTGLTIPMHVEMAEFNSGLALIDTVQETDSPIPVVCVSNDLSFLNYASIKRKIPGIYPGQSLPVYNSNRPLLIFVAMKKKFGMELLESMDQQAIRKLGETPNWVFYSRIITPGTQ
jgi:hypothetical protein